MECMRIYIANINKKRLTVCLVLVAILIVIQKIDSSTIRDDIIFSYVWIPIYAVLEYDKYHISDYMILRMKKIKKIKYFCETNVISAFFFSLIVTSYSFITQSERPCKEIFLLSWLLYVYDSFLLECVYECTDKYMLTLIIDVFYFAVLKNIGTTLEIQTSIYRLHLGSDFAKDTMYLLIVTLISALIFVMVQLNIKKDALKKSV